MNQTSTDSKPLHGKTALITGASRGIGEALARGFATAGATVICAARTLDHHPSLPGSLQETVAAIRAAGGTAHALTVDLADAASRQALTASALAIAPIDILVNNAAASFYLPWSALSSKRFHIAMEVNVHAPFELAQALLPAMIERGRGWILNISSATAKLPEGPPFDTWATDGGAIAYGSSKAALNRMTAGLAAELYRHNITVNTLAPRAAILTPGMEAMGIDRNNPNFHTEPVEAFVAAALRLCSCAADEYTGQICYSLDLLEREAGT